MQINVPAAVNAVGLVCSLYCVLWSSVRYTDGRAGVEQMSEKTVQFKEYKCRVKMGLYENGRRAMQLVDAETGEPVLTATSNLVNEPNLGQNQAFIKNYSENSGILDVLIAAGVVKDTGVRVMHHYCKYPLVDIL